MLTRAPRSGGLSPPNGAGPHSLTRKASMTPSPASLRANWNYPTSVRFGTSDETAIGSLLAILIVFSVLASIVWSFFFVRERRRRRLEEAVRVE